MSSGSVSGEYDGGWHGSTNECLSMTQTACPVAHPGRLSLAVRRTECGEAAVPAREVLLAPEDSVCERRGITPARHTVRCALHLMA